MNDGTISDHAAKGGKARARSLSAARRQEIARQAVETRWEKAGKRKGVPAVICGSADQPLRIGNIEIPCYVLDDERRVLVQGGMMAAMDMSQGTASKQSQGDRLAKFVATKSVKPYISNGLCEVITGPVKFKVGGSIAYGYEATVLADLCDAVLEARREGKLNYQQEHIAERCEILVRSFAKVGIVALVDEATGYQYMRQRDALEELLEEILSDELRRWVRTFPPAYFKGLCRLRHVAYRADMKLPQYFGHLTNDVVYSRLAPKVLDELKDRSPRNSAGNRPNKLFQWLSEGVGHPKLLQHLGTVIGLMKISDDWDTFKDRLDIAAPIYEDMPLFAHLDPDDS